MNKSDRISEEQSLLIKTLGDTPKLRIVDFLIDNMLFDFSKKEIIEGSGLTKPTFYKYFECLVKDKIVIVSRIFGKTKLYKLNKENPQVKALLELDLNLSKNYAAKIEEKLMISA